MATINFTVERNKAKSNDQSLLIYLRYDHNSRKVLFTTNIKASINQINWIQDRGHEKVKISQPLKKSYLGYIKGNIELKRLYEKLYSAMTQAKEENDESCRNVKKIFNNLDLRSGDVKSIIEGIDKYTAMYSSEYGKSTIDNYDVNLRFHISGFNEFKKKEHTLMDLDTEFELEFKKFLRKEQKLEEPSVDNNIKYLKSLCNKLEPFGVKTNPLIYKFKRISKSIVDKDIVALTEEEMLKIANSPDLENEDLNRTKDLFTFQLFTGLRVGDLLRFNKNMISPSGRLKTRAGKTKTPIETPLVLQAKVVLEKYSYELPKISEQNYNKGIKKVLKKLGINRKLEQFDYKAVFEIASSHLAKKSFISYCLNSKALSPIQVSKITGTKVETILRYYAGAEMEEIEKKLLN
ncbi:MAG: phage integrase SAM-like domain-containing protein [Bacteroidota bacterium]